MTEDLQLQVSGPPRYTRFTDKTIAFLALFDAQDTVIGYLYANDEDDAAGWVAHGLSSPDQQNLASPWMAMLRDAKQRGLPPVRALETLRTARPSNGTRAQADALQVLSGIAALEQLALAPNGPSEGAGAGTEMSPGSTRRG